MSDCKAQKVLSKWGAMSWREKLLWLKNKIEKFMCER
jgi:hypothetical protein